ncbi:MAG TPA: universal stress protein [Terriglobia bacterium]|nr:universal stress protein [Terriglobia bacterium]
MQSAAGRVTELINGVANPCRVMVGTDRSETAERAVRWAADLADRFRADLHAVQVIDPEHHADLEHGAADRVRVAAMTDHLIQHARSIAGDRGRARVVIDDDPAMALVRAAAEDEVDILVVGNAGMAGRKEQSQKLKVRALRVFEAIERLIGARPGQMLDVNFRAASLERTVRRAGQRLALGLMGGFAVLASALTAIPEHVGSWVPIAFGLVGVVFMLALVLDLLHREDHLGRMT